MQKVKVQRYVSGKKPDYARGISSDESSDDDDFVDKKGIVIKAKDFKMNDSIT